MNNKTYAIAFGSNQGFTSQNIRLALENLTKHGIIKALSPLFKTKPEGFLEQPDFTNGAILFETALEPLPLLNILKQIEKQIGRAETFRNGPREIDLDIILCGDTIINTPELTIPHPACHLREFVLAPLSFIAPQAIHPVLKKTVIELLDGAITAKGESDCKLVVNNI